MKTIRTLLVVFILSITAFAATKVTLVNKVKFDLRLIVDHEFACLAPTSSECSVFVSDDEHYFAVTDVGGNTLQTSDRFMTGKPESWVICYADDPSPECN